MDYEMKFTDKPCSITGARIAIPDVTYCLYYQGRTALADRADHVIFLLGLKCPLYRGE